MSRRQSEARAVKVPSTYLDRVEVPETTVEVGDDGSVTWRGEVIGSVRKGTRTYSPPTHKGSRIAKYHKQVPEWYAHRPGAFGRPDHRGDTRQYVLQHLIADMLRAES